MKLNDRPIRIEYNNSGIEITKEEVDNIIKYLQDCANKKSLKDKLKVVVVNKICADIIPCSLIDSLETPVFKNIARSVCDLEIFPSIISNITEELKVI